MRTEKRKAKVGERILITDAQMSIGKYKVGDILTVEESIPETPDELGHVFAKGIGVFIFDGEYEVIVDETEVDKVSGIDEHKAAVEHLVKALGYIDLAKSSFMVGGYASEYNAKEGLDEVAKQICNDIEIHESHIRRLTEKERKLTRDEIIEKAKREVEEIRNDPIQTEGLLATFVVYREKRMVAALLSSVLTGVVERQGIAKCHPDDCFNIHLGKIIALYKALGLEVPDEYLNVPQPTEVRGGDRFDNERITLPAGRTL